MLVLEHVLKEWWGLYIRLFNKYRCSEITRLFLVCLRVKRLLAARGLWLRICLESTQTVLLSSQESSLAGLWRWHHVVKRWNGQRNTFFILTNNSHIYTYGSTLPFIILGTVSSFLVQIIKFQQSQRQNNSGLKAKYLGFVSHLDQSFLSNVKTLGLQNSISLTENPNIHQWRKNVLNINSAK